MVAIFTGDSNGLERGSAATLGAGGLLGGASLGRSGEQVFVNALTGNLVVRQQDEFLVGKGPDGSVSRTYNSQGGPDRIGTDLWRLSTDRYITSQWGVLNQAGSGAVRVSADGTNTIYYFNDITKLYEAKDDAGAHDTLSYSALNGGRWTWRDGDSQVTESYSFHSEAGRWRVDSITDADGIAVSYAYDGTSNDGPNAVSLTTSDGTVISYVWQGNKITQISTSFTDLGAAQPTRRSVSRTFYTYDTRDRLSTVTVDLTPGSFGAEPGAAYTTTYMYVGTSNLIQSIRESDGSRVDFDYDSSAAPRVTTITQYLTSSRTQVTTLTYGQSVGTDTATVITDALGQQTKLVYNSDKTLKTIIAPAAGGTARTTSFEYADAGHVTKITSPIGITTFTYDVSGNMTSRADAGGTVSWTYGAGNTRLTETRTGTDDTTASAGAAHTTWYVYDTSFHLRYTVSSLGDVNEYRYSTTIGDRDLLQYVVGYPESQFNVNNLNTTVVPTLQNLDDWKSALSAAKLTTIELSRYTYDARGNVTSTRDYGVATDTGAPSNAEGFSLTNWIYDEAGRLVSRQRSGYAAETFAYDGLGRVISTTATNGATTSIQFNDAGMTTVVTLASGLVQTSTYDKAGELLSFSESGSGIATAATTYKYDLDGRIRVITDPLGNSSYILYDTANRKIADVASDGALTEYRYDANDRLVATIRYTSPVAPLTLNDSSNPTASLSNPDNTLDLSAIRPNSANAPSTDWTWQVYDTAGRVIETILGDGSATLFDYDASDQLVRTTRFANLLSSGQLTTLRSGPPTTAIVPVGDSTRDMVTRTFYDKAGRLLATMDAAGFVVLNTYDHSDRLTKTTAFAAATTVANRAGATLTAIVGAILQGGNDRVSRLVYDGQGLLRYTVDSLNHVVEFGYDAGDYQTAVTAYAGSIASTSDFTFDNVEALVASGQLAADPDTRRSYTVRNQAGQVAYTVDATGMVAAYKYDVVGRVITVTRFATLRTATTTPNLGGLDTFSGNNVANTNNRITRTYYDVAGRVSMTVDGEGYVVRNEYDKADNLTATYRYERSVTASDSTTANGILTQLGGSSPSPVGWTKYTYDVQNRVTDEKRQVDAATSGFVCTHYEYDEDGTLSAVTEGYGTGDTATTSYTYDHAGRALTQTRGAGAVAATISYEYDGLGNVTKITDPRLNVSVA